MKKIDVGSGQTQEMGSKMAEIEASACAEVDASLRRRWQPS